MGKKYSPGLANIYLEHLDNVIFSFKPKLYYRYLDDLFLVWQGDKKDTIREFEIGINNLIPDIKVEISMSEIEVNFLDITIFKNQDNGLSTKIYVKETDNRTLLHRRSHHPRHTFKRIISSQITRYKNLCSKREDFLQNSMELIKILKNQGYSFQRMKKILKNIDKKLFMYYL